MKGLETGKDKVKKICEALKKETLEPARQEADEMKAAAKREADAIIARAKDSAEEMLESARREIERQKQAFQASLSQACQQALNVLKEKIEHQLFNPILHQWITKPLQDPKVVAQLITAIVQAVEREGLNADLTAFIAASIPAKEVNQLLASEILQRLKEKSVLLSPIGGGIEVKLVQDHITLDLSDAAVAELVANYIRKDFRELIFGA
jgi:V/A-type H+-transporting ATPase subunit E